MTCITSWTPKPIPIEMTKCPENSRRIQLLTALVSPSVTGRFHSNTLIKKWQPFTIIIIIINFREHQTARGFSLNFPEIGHVGI